MGALDARRMTRAKLWRAGLGCEAADGSSVVRLARWGTWEVHDSKAAIYFLGAARVTTATGRHLSGRLKIIQHHTFKRYAGVFDVLCRALSAVVLWCCAFARRILLGPPMRETRLRVG